LLKQPPEPCGDVNVVGDQNPGTAEETDSEDQQKIFQCQHDLFPFSLLPVTLEDTDCAIVQVLCRKLRVKLPLHLKRARNQPRAVRNRQAHRAAVRRSRLHQPDRKVKKRGLQGQRRKQRQHRDDDHSSKSKHCFHVCAPKLRWAMQLFAIDNGS
jgi:hypothetical protein